MLRELINHGGKAAEATYIAATELKTGMGVVKNVDGTCSVPAKATAANIFLVEKARIPTGLNTGRTNLSDYEDEFVTVYKDALVKLNEYDFGEVFGTDQFAATLTDEAKGKTLHVGTDGKWDVATGASVYRFRGFYMDAGRHQMAEIEVLKDAVTNG